MRQYSAQRMILVVLLALLAGCGTSAPPRLVVGQTPTPVPNVGPPSAAQATTTTAMATAQAQARRGGPRQRLWLITGGSGSAEERFGRGIAQSITDKLDGYEGTVEVSNGDALDLIALGKHQSDLAIVTTDAAAEALAVAGAALPVRALARLYPNALHLVVRADSSVRSLADLRGRTVALGAPGSPTEVLARRVLATASLGGPGDVVAPVLAPGEALLALRERTVDAVFWLGPAPAEPLTALAQRQDVAVRFIPLDEAATRLAAQHPGIYQPVTVPAATYPGQAQAVPTVGVDTVLVAVAGLDERLAYGVTRAMFDNIRELPFFHPAAQRLTLLTGAQVAPLPFHPGASRFYQEKGVLPPVP